jgi:hypothetical protein
MSEAVAEAVRLVSMPGPSTAGEDGREVAFRVSVRFAAAVQDDLLEGILISSEATAWSSI